MKRTTPFLLILKTLVVLFFYTNHAIAGGPPVKQVLDGNLDQLKIDSFLVVSDTLFFDPAYNSQLIKPYPVKNKISLKINGATSWFLQTAFTATVRFRINTTDANNAISSTDTSLTINYRADSSYINESSYIFNGAYRAEVIILEVITDAGWDVWKTLQFENELQSFPVFNFDCTDNAIQSVSAASLPPDTKADELPVSWGNVAAADEYDLEWAYIDSSALAAHRYTGITDPDPALIFENNASRVSITGTSYNIPLLYDNKGKLFFRVRPVRFLSAGGRMEAAWSSDNLPEGLGEFEFNGHERTLNWQSTTSFAEEGKRKSVIQYYDGSLRGRQTVTKDNSTQTTIVAEDFYDYQGRPVIKVMPAPTLNNLIGYSRNFNISLNDSAYNKDDFDLLEDSSLYCNAGAGAMKTDSGSSRYYSPENPDKNTGFNRFIPDAEGYPFTEVQYTQDNTGRISSQSGVGNTHRLGSGHESKYYYGTPDQEELDAMFGTEVGDRSHYFKNMVRDANGQYSISYVDMHGRTIATALAGVPATKMDPDGITGYLWSKVSGESATIVNPSSSSTSVTGLTEGVYVFRLTVTDHLGAIETSDVTITVNSTSGAPSANAGADQTTTLPTDSITLSGTATDAGGTITNYSWTKVSGGDAEIVSPDTDITVVRGLVQGDYIFRLTVTDNTGAQASSEIKVAVYPASASLEVTRFNFTDAAVSVTDWVNLAGDPHVAVRTGTDPVTGISVSSVAMSNWYPYAAGNGTASDGTGVSNGTFFPSAVMRNHWFQFNTALAAFDINKPQLEISGLIPGVPYTFRMTGSGTIAFFKSTTRYRISGTELYSPVDVNTYQNAANGVVFSNVFSDANGKARIYLNTIPEENTNMADINGIEITRNSPYLSVNTNGDQVIKLPASSLTLAGWAVDPKAAVTSYAWSQLHGEPVTFSTPSGASTSVTGFVAGNYVFRLTIKNALGAFASKDIAVTVYPESSAPTAVSFNFTDTGLPVYLDGWINMSGDPHLVLTTGRDPVSGISLSSVSTSNWTPFASGSGTASNGYGAPNGTFFPAEVMDNHWYNYKSTTSSFDSSRPQLELSGLTPGIPYTVKMTGSQTNTFNSLTRYHVAGLILSDPVDIETKNNTANGAVFANILPDNNGKIRIYVNTITSPATDLASINGVQIIIDNQPPVADAGFDQVITLPVNTVTLSGSGLDPEAGNTTTVTRKLLDSTNNIVNGTVIQSSKSLLVPVGGVHTFSYSLNADSLQIEDCSDHPICYDCLYDLRITITDDCNNQKLGGQAFDTLVRNFSFGAIDTSALTATQGFIFSFSKYLEEGNYEITKTLSISNYAQDYYRDSIFMIKNHCIAVDSFIREQRILLSAQADCAPSCQKCLDSLGSWETFRENFMLKAGIDPADTAGYRGMALEAYEAGEEACKLLCGQNDQKDDIRASMLADVTPPSGQYANPDSLYDKYSVFYTDLDDADAFPDTVAHFRKPVYLDEEGQPDKVYDEAAGKEVTPGQLSPEAFVQKFKPSWAEALLQYHPEYRKLTEIEDLSDSYAWDQRFALVDTYLEAYNKGYLDPTDGTGTPFTKYKVGSPDNDPIRSVGTYKADLEKELKEYKENNIGGAAGISLWGLATAATMCGETATASTCFTQWGSNDNAFDGTTMCTGDLDMAWRNFRQLYLSVKRDIINSHLAAIHNDSTAIAAGVLLAAGHQSGFADATSLLEDNGFDYVTNATDADATKQTTQTALTSYYADNCKTYAIQWWQQLKPCNYSSQDSVNIISALIEVCKEGSDADHPLGSSTVKPSSTYLFRSFEDVMKYYSSSTYNSNCNAYLITAPQPYEQQKALATRDIWKKPDTCQCAVISDWYIKYQTIGQSDASFSDFLYRVAGTTISNGVLDTLRKLCNNEISCTYLPSPIVLPPALQCGVKDVCVTCEMVKEYYNRYKTEFPYLTPSLSANNASQIEKNQLFEKFMNYKSGFSKQAEEYLQFMQACAIPINNSCDTCQGDCEDSTLKVIVNDFINDYYNNGKKYDAYGSDTSTWIVDYGSIYNSTGHPHHIFFNNGIAQFPYNLNTDTVPDHGDFDFIARDSACINGGMSIEFKLKDHGYAGEAFHELTLALHFNDNSIKHPELQHKYYINFNKKSLHWNYISFIDPSTPANQRTYLDVSEFMQDYSDWSIVKFEMIDSLLNFYVNGEFLRAFTFPEGIQLNKFFGVSIRSTIDGHPGASFDWIKAYDKNNRLFYQEDFDNNDDFKLFEPYIKCPRETPQNAFTQYFNEQQNTNYSFAQIDSIYSSNCENYLNVSFIGKQDSLKNIQRAFNVDQNPYRVYTYCQANALTPSVYSDLNTIVKDGYMCFPDSVQELNVGGYCYHQFSSRGGNLCWSNGYSVETRFKFLKQQRDGDMFYILFQNLSLVATNYHNGFIRNGQSYPPGLYLTSVSTKYDDSTVTLLNSVINGVVRLFDDPDEIFNNWATLKVKILPGHIYIYGNDELKVDLLRNADYPLHNAGNLTYAFWNLQTAIDRVRIFDENDVVKYDEDFNNPDKRAMVDPSFICPPRAVSCTAAFTTYFNAQQHSNFSFAQIDSLYRAYDLMVDVCGVQCSICTPENTFTGPLLCGKSDPVFPAITMEAIDNCTDSSFFAVSKGTEYYQLYRDSLKNHFDSSYVSRCLQAYRQESFTVTRPNSEYHYTLYYYDQAGNLVKTVPPAGVDDSKFRWSVAWSDSVGRARNNYQLLTPQHHLLTQYRYNTLNQVVASQTPDAGKSRFWYDRLGRLVLSRNARQYAAGESEEERLYSYTLYDALGRITEVGEIANTSGDTLSDHITRIPANLQSWLEASAAHKSQITSTVYDLAYGGFTGISPTPLYQHNLRNRVSYTSFSKGANPALYNQATFYTYDIHGNVDTLLQDYGKGDEAVVQNIMNTNNNRFKKILYNYDLISGKVNAVAYQPGKPDQFYHRYQYDAQNRLTEVRTSIDSVHWQKDARYEYYKHGPLARTLLGDQLVQGIDYAYTLQGWLKGMNSTALTPEEDMSGDGLPAGQNQYIAQDAVGFSLHYYNGDYQPIGTEVAPFPALSGDHLQGSYRPLYNGNISSMAVNITKFDGPLLYNYKYDRLNRLTQLDAWQGFNANGNNWSGVTPTTDYKERIAYDPNGNILQYLRNTAGTTQPMDSMSYRYYAGTNRLSHIKDNAPPVVEGIKDIEDQPANNYSYDEIGNLTGDISENLPGGSIQWNVYGKITSITRSSALSGNNTRQINYDYDAAGNRIGKKVTKFGSAEVEYTWYVRDASGNVMAVYEAKKDTTGSTALSEFDVTLSEQQVYGSSRLGIQRRSEGVEGNLTIGEVYKHRAGLRYYELSNHLGNVLATVSDRKIGVASAANSSLIDHYLADVVSAQDYYPGGMLMPGRTFNATKYRYGFNGKENDNEVKGEGNQQDYGKRIYDPRVARFLSVDPIAKQYPELTPYQFASNTPIQAIDLDGLEAFFVHGTESNNTRWFIPDGSKDPDKTLMRGLLGLTRNSIGDASFNWTRRIPNSTINNDAIFSSGTHPLNRLTNNKMDRKIAAQDLVKHVMDYRKVHGIDQYDDNGSLVKLGNEPITFIGHSHGGNVSIQAANMIFDKYGIQSDVITIATPAYNGKNDIENPAYAKGIRKLLAIWNETDAVSGGLAGDDYYPVGPSSKVRRIEVNASGFYKGLKKGLGAHSFDNNHMEEFIKQVKANPQSETLKETSNE